MESLVDKYNQRLTMNEFCMLFGLDMENDERVKTFWNINENNRVIMDDKMYEHIGYRGIYSNKKQAFTKLLKKPKNSDIIFKELVSDKDPRKKYYVLCGKDFETLLAQMKTTNVLDIRHLMQEISDVQRKFHEYQTIFEQRNLAKSIKELKTLMTSEVVRAEEREQRAVERNTILTNQIKRNVTILNTIIAPRMAPLTKKINKRRQIGLYKTQVDGEWYLMRRQQEGWKEAEQMLLLRNMRLVKRWDNVSHAVDIGNVIKERYRQFDWFAVGNYLRVRDTSTREEETDESLSEIITGIINEDNEANLLANENVKCTQ